MNLIPILMCSIIQPVFFLAYGSPIDVGTNERPASTVKRRSKLVKKDASCYQSNNTLEYLSPWKIQNLSRRWDTFTKKEVPKVLAEFSARFHDSILDGRFLSDSLNNKTLEISPGCRRSNSGIVSSLCNYQHGKVNLLNDEKTSRPYSSLFVLRHPEKQGDNPFNTISRRQRKVYTLVGKKVRVENNSNKVMKQIPKSKTRKQDSILSKQSSLSISPSNLALLPLIEPMLCSFQNMSYNNVPFDTVTSSESRPSKFGTKKLEPDARFSKNREIVFRRDKTTETYSHTVLSLLSREVNLDPIINKVFQENPVNVNLVWEDKFKEILGSPPTSTSILHCNAKCYKQPSETMEAIPFGSAPEAQLKAIDKGKAVLILDIETPSKFVVLLPSVGDNDKVASARITAERGLISKDKQIPVMLLDLSYLTCDGKFRGPAIQKVSESQINFQAASTKTNAVPLQKVAQNTRRTSLPTLIEAVTSDVDNNTKDAETKEPFVLMDAFPFTLDPLPLSKLWATGNEQVLTNVTEYQIPDSMSTLDVIKFTGTFNISASTTATPEQEKHCKKIYPLPPAISDRTSLHNTAQSKYLLIQQSTSLEKPFHKGPTLKISWKNSKPSLAPSNDNNIDQKLFSLTPPSSRCSKTPYQEELFLPWEPKHNDLWSKLIHASAGKKTDSNTDASPGSKDYQSLNHSHFFSFINV